MNRGRSRLAAACVFVSLLGASLTAVAAPAFAGARCNSVGQTDVTLTSASASSGHTFTIANQGPACAVDVAVAVVLKSSDGSTLDYRGVGSSSSPTWNCSPSAPVSGSSLNVRCVLGAAIPAGKSAFVELRVGETAASQYISAAVEIPRNTNDPRLSDNVVWGSFGTSASSAQFPDSANEVKNQNVVVTRGERQSISINQLSNDSTLGVRPPAPCAATNVCLTSGQVSVSTPSLPANDVAAFLANSNARITTVITVDSSQDVRARVPQVWRFVDFGSNPPNSWVTLPSCSPAVDPVVGCVASISVSTDLSTLGHLRIEVWTTHNGHYQ